MVSVQALRGVHDGHRSFTVVDSDALPINCVETFLRHLGALGYSLNTVKAYAHDLADLFTWLRYPGQRPQATPGRQSASEASLQRRLEALTQRNKELRSENQDLRRRLEIVHGQLRAQDQGGR